MIKCVWDPDGWRWDVYLDGRLLADAFYADEERGLVFCLDTRGPNCHGANMILSRGEVKVRMNYRSPGTAPCPHCGTPQEPTETRCTACQRLIG